MQKKQPKKQRAQIIGPPAPELLKKLAMDDVPMELKVTPEEIAKAGLKFESNNEIKAGTMPAVVKAIGELMDKISKTRVAIGVLEGRLAPAMDENIAIEKQRLTKRFSDVPLTRAFEIATFEIISLKNQIDDILTRLQI